jgi:hypothetical protein
MALSFPVSTPCQCHRLWCNHLDKPNQPITVAVWSKARNVSPSRILFEFLNTEYEIALTVSHRPRTTTKYTLASDPNKLNRWRTVAVYVTLTGRSTQLQQTNLRSFNRQNSSRVIYWLHPTDLPNSDRPSHVTSTGQSTLTSTGRATEPTELQWTDLLTPISRST